MHTVDIFGPTHLNLTVLNDGSRFFSLHSVLISNSDLIFHYINSDRLG